MLKAVKSSVGDMIEDKGIYLGILKVSLNKRFSVYAAPSDLKTSEGKRLLLTFNDAVQHVAGLRDWYGHDGVLIETEAQLHSFIQNKRYDDLAKWFIPPAGMLADNNKKKKISLYRDQNIGALSGTVCTPEKKSGHPDPSRYYWSCSEDQNDRVCVQSVKMDSRATGFKTLGGACYKNRKNLFGLSTRPVRMENL